MGLYSGVYEYDITMNFRINQLRLYIFSKNQGQF